ncbi:hypothetical protein [Kineococcus indalonis]|uniref:hypothetical protein n=1 Tax=Kineococcus indalonis TaxID=2696566 RepID=UPI0014129647|nr:hypothetical protein [Kineococcus indalonis]NAZ88454.1 hypothetical protein [Kineococcus indalonis]
METASAPPPPQRSWTLEELRHAARLAFTTGPGERVDTAALAAAAGVSPRQVQRWLGGHARPGQQAAHRLRAALLPAPDVLQRQEDDARNAAEAAAEVERASQRDGAFSSPVALWAERGWLGEHLLLVVLNPDLGYARAGVVGAHAPNVARLRTSPPRPASVPGGRWQVLDAYGTGHRFDAVVLRHALLREVGPWRTRVHPDRMPKGHSDGWLAGAPVPDLSRLARRAGVRGRRERHRWVEGA